MIVVSGPESHQPVRGRSDPPSTSYRTIGPLFGAGIQLALAVVAMFFLGRWLDEKFGTQPWLMIAGSLIGVSGGLISFVRTVSEVSRQEGGPSGKR